MDTFFTGQADYTLDAKNRLTVPARYRERFQDGVVLAKDVEPCVAIWPAADYASFCEAAIAQEHPMSQRARMLRAFFSANAFDAELDSAGRVALQPFLMEHGELEREVTVAGVGDHVQVWTRPGWKSYSASLVDSMAEFSVQFDDLGPGRT